MKYIYSFITFFLLLNCAKKADKESIGLPKKIDFENIEKVDSLISPRSLFSKVEFLLLKTPDSTKITIPSKIEEFQDKLIVLDHRKKQLFAFDQNGNFISIVGTKGEGPGEFREVTDFDTHENFIYILSRPDFSIYKFDQNFKFNERIKLDEWGWQFSILESGNIALYSLIAEGEDEYNINVYSPKGKLLSKRMPYDINGEYQGMNYSGFINKEFYTYPLSSIIYKINELSSSDSVVFEINFPDRFPESEIKNHNTYLENGLYEKNDAILTKFELGQNGEFICYYHFREGNSNGYTLGIQLKNGRKFGHLNLKHAGTKSLDDIYVQMFFTGPYNIPAYSQYSESYFIASNLESIAIYQESINEMIANNKIHDIELLNLLKQTDLEETILMKFKLKESL